MKVNLKIKYTTVLLILLSLTVFNIPYLSQTINNIITLALEFVVTAMSFKFKETFKNIKLCWAIGLFLVVSVLCTILNRGFDSVTMTAIVTNYKYVLLFCVVRTLVDRIGLINVANTVWKTFLPFVVLSSLCVIVTMGNGIGGNEVLPYYLTGNKFFVSYTNMAFLALCHMQDCIFKKPKHRKIGTLTLTVVFALISLIAGCNTGLIGLLVMGILLFFNDKKGKLSKLLTNPLFYCLVIFGLTFLLIGTNALLQSSAFQDLITNVFKRDVTWTGRVEMFALALVAFAKSPIYGFGMNSTYISDILGWGNAQNGILKIMLDFGTIGLIVFGIVCWNVFSHKKVSIVPIKRVFPMVAFLYGMAVCCTVEINLSGMFFLGLAFVNSLKSYNNSDLNRKDLYLRNTNRLLNEN